MEPVRGGFEMDIDKLKREFPETERLACCEELFWENKNINRSRNSHNEDITDIDDAEARLQRFAPLISKLFPEVIDGIIESELREIPAMKGVLDSAVMNRVHVQGRLFLKCDSHLPVSGSIKARGGIYEVLKFAEKTAMDSDLLTEDDDYSILADDKCRELFSKYSISVGSTGNLGLSIGIISAALGFSVTVHMSSDARAWKKELLRSKGVTVVEYPDDYEAAVAQGRKSAENDPSCHFVDDENSRDLFAGYAVAGKRLKKQLEDQGIIVDADHRLYVYIPCGVGGAPGGVTYGIKHYFGDNAYCFFAEPTHAPCMTLGLVTGLHEHISVGDIGIDGKTEADGLAVGRPSPLVSGAMESRVSGCFTVDDSRLYPYLAQLESSEDIFIEPSASAAFEGLKYINENDCTAEGKCFVEPDENSIHIIWATGGNMVPENEKQEYILHGKSML